ncbi:hypothetical protein CWO28_01405 [Vibrio splendidus]|nr:hypothetical protein CWO28_01405 [Vibrio splendidus]
MTFLKENYESEADSIRGYEAYTKSLLENKQSLPVNQFGDVNFSGIAKACSNRRQWFSENSEKVMPNDKTLKATIAFDVKMLGTTIIKPRNSDTILSEEANKLLSSPLNLNCLKAPVALRLLS